MNTIPFAVQYDSPNYFPASLMTRPRKAVVLHRTDGSFMSAIHWFMSPASEVSSHVVISEAGAAAQMVSLERGACTNGLRWSGSGWLTPVKRHPVVPTWKDIIPGVNPNLYTTTIELAGLPADPVTPKMLATLIRVLQFIADRDRIWYEPHRTLIGHFEINPVDKGFCPGPNVHFDLIAEKANTRWFPAPVFKTLKAAAVIYQAPDIHSKYSATLPLGVTFTSDAVSVGKGFQKFYHMVTGQGFIHEDDVMK